MKPESRRSPADEPSEVVDARAAARVDEDLPALELPREPMLEVFGHARECYPEECCGLIAGPPDGAPSRTIRCTNVQNQRRSQGESDLGADQAFWIDDSELCRALKTIEDNGETLKLIYHSHVDAGVYLSQTDVRAALGPEGEPLYMEVAQLVVSVREAGVRNAGIFEWDPHARCFAGRAVREAS
ncbi:MAG: hypothetical protein GY725_22885 [bacterium]|nr:hypothetical protein [bacterium]